MINVNKAVKLIFIALWPSAVRIADKLFNGPRHKHRPNCIENNRSLQTILNMKQITILIKLVGPNNNSILITYQ